MITSNIKKTWPFKVTLETSLQFISEQNQSFKNIRTVTDF